MGTGRVLLAHISPNERLKRTGVKACSSLTSPMMMCGVATENCAAVPSTRPASRRIFMRVGSREGSPFPTQVGGMRLRRIQESSGEDMPMPAQIVECRGAHLVVAESRFRLSGYDRILS